MYSPGPSDYRRSPQTANRPRDHRRHRLLQAGSHGRRTTTAPSQSGHSFAGTHEDNFDTASQAEWVAKTAARQAFLQTAANYGTFAEFLDENESVVSGKPVFQTDPSSLEQLLDMYRQTAAAISDVEVEQADYLRQLLGEVAPSLLNAIQTSIFNQSESTREKGDQRGAARYVAMVQELGYEVISALPMPRAQQLAEIHRNYKTLVKIVIAPARIDEDLVGRYLDSMFAGSDVPSKVDGDAFAKVLFETLIEQGRICDLLDQQPRHREMLADFLGDKYPQWAWVNNVSLRDYAGASRSLEVVASSTGSQTARALARLTALAA